jgi:hypothetical protein
MISDAEGASIETLHVVTRGALRTSSTFLELAGVRVFMASGAAC